MKDDDYIVTDPAGYDIYLPVGLCNKGGEMNIPANVFKSIEEVIEAPSCIIEMPNQGRCYFRSLGWNLTMLICVELQGGKWTAISCSKNPSEEHIQKLLKEGTFIPGSSLG